MGPRLLGLTMATKKGWKNRGMLAGVTDCGRSRKWAAEEDWRWDLNPGTAVMLGGDYTALGCSLLPHSLGIRRDLAGKKRVKGLLLVGHKKVPRGFRLTEDCGGDAADGAGNRRRLASLVQIAGN